MKKYILLIIVVVALGGWWAYQSQQPKTINIDIPEATPYAGYVNEDIDQVIEEIIEQPLNDLEDKNIEEVVVLEPEPNTEEVVVENESNSVNLAVPFTSQAPSGNWEQPYQDACEEASVLMTIYYYENKAMPSVERVEAILSDMVDWQEANLAGTHDITISQTAQLTEEYFDYQTKLVPDLTANKIRDLLRQGFPVIIPANGHILNNPYYSGDGPDYHMLVIKGFVDDKFITNDPGTKRGGDFIYTEANLMEAIADWDAKKALATGPKTGLIIYRD